MGKPNTKIIYFKANFKYYHFHKGKLISSGNIHKLFNAYKKYIAPPEEGYIKVVALRKIYENCIFILYGIYHG